ncbi:MAG TPA: hypothetical protein VLX92_27895 [Kofleriaceae bacterium]|nr:hypothetical protein [Kofleriaceae bacterium]
MRCRLATLGIAIAATSSHAGPWSVDADGGMQLAPLADDDVFGRLAVAVRYAWHDRWIAGARLSFAIDPSTSMALPSGANIRSYLIEGGVRLHPSARLGIELGWRVGRAGIDFGFAYVHTTDLEPFAALTVPLGAPLELRIEPLVVDLYRSSTWQTTIGVNAGLAWRL